MNENRYAPPTSKVADIEDDSLENVEYVGFWLRVLAAIVDSILIGLITMPALVAVYGSDAIFADDAKFVQGPADIVISYVLPAVATILFWLYRQATPGKMLIGARVVRADTLRTVSAGQAIGRYFAYFPAGLLLGLGIIWVAFDARKQGLHDKLANTVVVRRRR